MAPHKTAVFVDVRVIGDSGSPVVRQLVTNWTICSIYVIRGYEGSHTWTENSQLKANDRTYPFNLKPIRVR